MTQESIDKKKAQDISSESAVSLFDALYTRFLMRDILAKVAPGGLIFFVLQEKFGINLTSRLGDQGLLTAIVGLCLFWAIGFANQELANRLGIVQWFRDRYVFFLEEPAIESLYEDSRAARWQRTWHHLQRACFGFMLPQEFLEYQRVVVIKEATGNFSFAIALSYLLLTVGDVPFNLGGICTYILSQKTIIVSTAVAVLYYAHFRHRHVQTDWIIQILKKNDWKPVRSEMLLSDRRRPMASKPA